MSGSLPTVGMLQQQLINVQYCGHAQEVLPSAHQYVSAVPDHVVPLKRGCCTVLGSGLCVKVNGTTTLATTAATTAATACAHAVGRKCSRQADAVQQLKQKVDELPGSIKGMMHKQADDMQQQLMAAAEAAIKQLQQPTEQQALIKKHAAEDRQQQQQRQAAHGLITAVCSAACVDVLIPYHEDDYTMFVKNGVLEAAKRHLQGNNYTYRLKQRLYSAKLVTSCTLLCNCIAWEAWSCHPRCAYLAGLVGLYAVIVNITTGLWECCTPTFEVLVLKVQGVAKFSDSLSSIQCCTKVAINR